MKFTGIFVTGTDTNVGKTVLSALLVAALDGIYWKPIQTGLSEGSDRETVIRLARIPASRTHEESYRFDPPVSPHLAAQWAGKRIDLSSIHRPQTPPGAPLIAEGAGGVMVPINESELMTGLMRHLDLPVIVASRSTLGTINHTLLTFAALERAGIETIGAVLIGPENSDNCAAIERYGGHPVIGRIPMLDRLSRETLVEVFRAKFDSQVFA
jgi:dethiobiotin synthetase